MSLGSYMFCLVARSERIYYKDTRPLKQTRHGVGGRRTALLLRLGLYTPPSSRTASSRRFVGGPCVLYDIVLIGARCKMRLSVPFTTSVQLKMSNRDFSKTARRNTYF